MKNRLIYLLLPVLALCLILAVPVSSESPPEQADSLKSAAAAFQEAGTMNEQLDLLGRLADTYAAELEAGSWDVSLRVKCADDLPEELIPMNFEEYGYTRADTFPEETRGHKFIALYIARDGDKPELAGEWLARFPKDMRAASLEEAEYALVAEGWWTPSGYKYIPAGSSSHRDYAAYVLNLQTGEAVRFWSHRNSAKMSGTIGQLSGDSMSSSEMWTALRAHVWGVIRFDIGSGAALFFTPTGANCYLKGYEGDPVNVVVPSEVEGYPVTSMANGVFSDCHSLETIVLPDSLAEIPRYAFSACENLAAVTLPSHLESIGSGAFSYCSSLTDIELPDGLKSIDIDAFFNSFNLTGISIPRSVESIGEQAFADIYGFTEFTIPAGIASIGRYLLWNCSYLARVVVEEGVEYLSDDIFADDTCLACIWLPASLSRSYGLDSIDPHAVIYAPENSYALQWARENGYEAAACDVPEDMPAAGYVTEDGLSFRIFRDEAMLSSCTQESSGITVPEAVNGIPVTGVLCAAVYKQIIESVTLPESVRIIHHGAIRAFKGVREFHVYVPNPDCLIENEGLYYYKGDSSSCLTVHGPEGSAVQRYVTDMDQPDRIFFEPMGESVDANVRTLKDARTLAGQVQENTASFWQSCDRSEYSLLASVPGYDIGRPDAVVILRISKAELTDTSMQMAGNANALKMYATLANTKADKAYAKAAAQTSQVSRLTPVADGVSAVVVLAYPDDWILVSLMQDGNSQAILLTKAAGLPEELTAAYVAEAAAACGVEGECILYSGESFAVTTGR